MPETSPRIAVLIPCHNEELTVAKVVKDFKEALPSAVIYVYDNASSDKTFEEASLAGAIVRKENRLGKGNVVSRMFADIDADVYVMVDGDCTHDSSDAPKMIEKLLNNNLDIVNGVRISKEKEAYRFGHRFGNWLLGKIVSVVFKSENPDMLSGYKVFSRRFVKTFPWQCSGFDLETKLTIYAMEMKMPVGNIKTQYLPRPKGSSSKLNTYRDGIYILSAIFLIMKEERSFMFFSFISVFLLLLGIALGIPLVLEYQETHLVSRIPTAIIIVGILICSVLSFFCGLILDTVAKGHKEARRNAYLSFKAPGDS